MVKRKMRWIRDKVEIRMALPRVVLGGEGWEVSMDIPPGTGEEGLVEHFQETMRQIQEEIGAWEKGLREGVRCG